ncbi:hypothetical protein T08_14947 [Trichinella sp. T8]|nr:hypothetical protein T08_14947 [Trichinella sp. T8]
MIKVHIFTAHHFLSRLRYQGPAALLGSQQWELKQARPPPAPPPALLPVNGDFPRAEPPSPVLARDRQICKFAIDVVPRLCFGSNPVVIVTPKEECERE